MQDHLARRDGPHSNCRHGIDRCGFAVPWPPLPLTGGATCTKGKLTDCADMFPTGVSNAVSNTRSVGYPPGVRIGYPQNPV